MRKLLFLFVLLVSMGSAVAQSHADTSRARQALHRPESAMKNWEVRLGYLDTTIVTTQEFLDNLEIGLRIAGPKGEYSKPIAVKAFSWFLFPKGGDYVKSGLIKGNKIPVEDSLLRKQGRGDQITFEDIKVEDDQHSIRSVGAIWFYIK